MARWKVVSSKAEIDCLHQLRRATNSVWKSSMMSERKRYGIIFLLERDPW